MWLFGGLGYGKGVFGFIVFEIFVPQPVLCVAQGLLPAQFGATNMKYWSFN